MSLDAVSWLLVILAMVNVSCTGVLVVAAVQHRDWPALTDRAFVGVLLAFIAVGAAMLGLNRLGLVSLGSSQAIVILAGGLVLVSVPSIVWVIQLLRGSFGVADETMHTATLARIEAGVEKAVERADAAYTEANTVNQKIDARTKAIAAGEEVEHT